MTGNAEMESAVPKNNANKNFSSCELLIPNTSGKYQATANPVKNGIIMEKGGGVHRYFPLA